MVADPYLYPGTDVLKNKFNCKDKEELKKLEADITKAKIFTILALDSGYSVDSVEHFKAVHKHLFSDVYEWAGEGRRANITKPERVLHGHSVEYTDCRQLEPAIQTAIEKFKEIKWHELDTDGKADKLTECAARLWRVHPFRDGNTRTTLAYTATLAGELGFRIDLDLLTKHENSRYVRDSFVLASIDEAPEKKHLLRIIKDSVERGQNMPFRSDHEQQKFERLQEIRGSVKDIKDIKSFLPTKDLYDAHAKAVLGQSGGIWRKDSDKEIYKSMLTHGMEELKIKEAIRRNSPAMAGKEKSLALDYANDIGKAQEIQLFKSKTKGKSR